MNTDKIKQVIKLQKEIREENDNIIDIDMIQEDGKVLVRPALFKELFTNREYSVQNNKECFFYRGIYDDILFSTNNETDIFN